MKTIIQIQRKKLGLRLHEVAAALGVDTSLISKFEKGTRLPTQSQVILLADTLSIPQKKLLSAWNAEKIWSQIKDDPYAEETLRLVNERREEYKTIDNIKHSTSVEQILTKIDQRKSQLDKLRKYDSYRIAEALELEYTFESNRIEGNTLTLQETNLVVNDGLTISGKSMREHLEAINHTEAIAFVKQLVANKSLVSERDLLQIHQLVLRGIDPKYAGKYRQIQVIISGSSHIPPAPYLVTKQMEDFFIWQSSQAPRLHPVVRAAELHERLVSIHPFIDGNGRTSRLLMNFELIKNGYVIANIKGDNNTRQEYYAALEEVRVKNNKDRFIQFVAKSELECLERYLDILS
ncbi:MAG: Fic family protein [Lentimonas sp.]|jgi:Fic family protein